MITARFDLITILTLIRVAIDLLVENADRLQGTTEDELLASLGLLSKDKRNRLLEKLDQGLTCKLILISAAAGFGKTTVLSEWVHQIKFPISWLSLDERNNDLIRFWTYFVTALQQSDQSIGESTLAMLRAAELPSHEAFLTPLINELAQLQTDLILVLDDYHFCDSQYTDFAAGTFTDAGASRDRHSC